MAKGFSDFLNDVPIDIGGEFIKIDENKLEYKKKLFERDFNFIPSLQEAYYNRLYVLMLTKREGELLNWQGEITHLIIKPRNNKPIKNHWAILNEIKNMIFNPEQIAIEIYPKLSELVDDVNLYHLWVFPENVSFNIGLHIPGWFDSSLI